MVTTIFIDFYGTLCHGKFWRDLEPETFAKIQAYMFESRNALINDWMVGKYTAEEINQILSQKFGLNEAALWNSFLKGCETMRADQTSLDLIKRLRGHSSFHLRFILITDNMDSFDRFVAPRMKLTDYFDKIINSYNTKQLKSARDGQTFMNVMNARNLVPQECVLIDDSARTCEIFTKLGGTAYTATEQTPLSYWLAQLETAAN